MPTNEYSMHMFWGPLNNYLQIIRFSNVPGWDSYETQQPLWAMDSVQYNPFEQVFFKHIISSYSCDEQYSAEFTRGTLC